VLFLQIIWKRIVTVLTDESILKEILLFKADGFMLFLQKLWKTLFAIPAWKFF
jgi:hypothetical protein